jgi:hypothetical protein
VLRSIVVLAVVLAGLVAWDRSLTRRREIEREESGRLLPLVPEERRNALVVAGVGVETAQGEHFVFGRSKGVWRLLEPPTGTYADEQALAGLVQSLTEAEGVVLTDEKARAKSYGFGGEVALRVTLHGTKLASAEDGDVLLCVDVGFPITGADGAYVRPLGTHQIWAIDKNPRDYLARPPGSSFPPLVDPHVIPAQVASGFGGLRRIEVVRADGAGFAIELAREDERGAPDPTRPSFVQDWMLVGADGSRTPCDPVPSNGYALFLLRIPYDQIVGPADLDPELAAAPAARVVVTPMHGEPFELLLGEPDRGGDRQLVNVLTQTAFGVSQEIADLVAPAAETVASKDGGNPWHEYVQVEGAAPALPPGLPGAPGK